MVLKGQAQGGNRRAWEARAVPCPLSRLSHLGEGTRQAPKAPELLGW